MRPLPRATTPPPPLPEYLASTPHAFTRAEVLTAWSRHHIDASLRAGTVLRVLPGVYAAAVHRHQPVVMGEAAALWAPRALVTGSIALRLYADDVRAPTHADLVTTNGDTLHPPPWIRVHQTGRPTEHGSPAGGVPCTTPPRALLDAWRYSLPQHRRDVLWEALWARVCSWRQLKRELERTPRVAGRRDLERVLAWFEEGATSPMEVHAKHITFADARFHEFEWQATLRLSTRRADVDMLHRATMVAVELDGDRYHSTQEARDADRERQTELAAAGYMVVRFGWRDVVDRPEWCRDRLLRVVGARSARPGSH